MGNQIFRSIVSAADIRESSDETLDISKGDSQLLYGESFEALELLIDHVYGRSLVDNYCGYIHKDMLKLEAAPPTHFVDTNLAHIYSGPDFKSRPVKLLPFMSRTYIQDENRTNDFVQIDKDQWIFCSAIKPLTELKKENKIIDTAKMFYGAPYLYGGRSILGIDCSSLVQLCILRSGIEACPADADQQEPVLGQTVSIDQAQPGDIAYFEGHTGIMLEHNQVLNATARYMKVVIEPLEQLIDAYGKITSLKRLTF
jgi:cell wall-associated NlpC family hydrolase